MTRRITISVPDHVAERLAIEPNASAYVTRCVENEIRGEVTRQMLADHGMPVTEEGLARARERVRRAMEQDTPERRRARRLSVEAARVRAGLPARPTQADR